MRVRSGVADLRFLVAAIASGLMGCVGSQQPNPPFPPALEADFHRLQATWERPPSKAADGTIEPGLRLTFKDKKVRVEEYYKPLSDQEPVVSEYEFRLYVPQGNYDPGEHLSRAIELVGDRSIRYTWAGDDLILNPRQTTGKFSGKLTRK